MDEPTDTWPRPRAVADEEPELAWPAIRSLACPAIIEPCGRDFCDVALARRSTREMRPGSLRAVVNTVAVACAARHVLHDDPRRRSRRISPSAGALHPIEIVLVPVGHDRVLRYDPFEHRLEVLRLSDRIALQTFKASCTAALPEALTTSIVLLGRLARVNAYYEDAQSLLWRDAGAVLQSLCMTATAFGLGSCPLGLLGHEVIAAIGLGSELVALGVIQLGQPVARN